MKNMTLILISALSFSKFAHADELQQCDTTSSSQVSYESESRKITSISGEIAREAYTSLQVTEEAPTAGTFPEDYLAKAIISAKYSDTKACWKIQIPSYLNGTYTGPSNCLSYSCNLIEKF
ncbi:MAG: hypothetical protein J0M15_16600 [Deltaproteobacteria bacterium]|jgi:hypothetical protein|nr:hypothetical protein [Deltaproteobacteria bacterium]